MLKWYMVRERLGIPALICESRLAKSEMKQLELCFWMTRVLLGNWVARFESAFFRNLSTQSLQRVAMTRQSFRKRVSYCCKRQTCELTPISKHAPTQTHATLERRAQCRRPVWQVVVPVEMWRTSRTPRFGHVSNFCRNKSNRCEVCIFCTQVE